MSTPHFRNFNPARPQGIQLLPGHNQTAIYQPRAKHFRALFRRISLAADRFLQFHKYKNNKGVGKWRNYGRPVWFIRPDKFRRQASQRNERTIFRDGSKKKMTADAGIHKVRERAKGISNNDLPRVKCADVLYTTERMLLRLKWNKQVLIKSSLSEQTTARFFWLNYIIWDPF